MSDLKQKILGAVKEDLACVEQALADHLHPISSWSNRWPAICSSLAASGCGLY